jgi:radical SAM superfamily enzyme YgiQ (UPF0313 family)
MSDKLKVVLVRPPQSREAVFHMMPPLGLGYLSAAVKDLPVDVEIIDCVQAGCGEKALVRRIRNEGPDLLGFTVYSHDLETVHKMSRTIKRDFLKKPCIIVGGPHPSVAPQHTLDFLADVDYAFQGESEDSFAALVRYMLARKKSSDPDASVFLSSIPGMVFRGEDGAPRVNARLYADDLDRFGFPDWRKIPPTRYFKTCHGVFYRNKRFAPIFTSRGCDRACSFCAARGVMGRRIRRRSTAHVIEEIETLVRQYRIGEIQILDDNFTADKAYVIDFCKKLIEAGLGIAWSCPNGIRLDTLDEEMLHWMKRSGCYSISVGIESGSQRVLDQMKKGLKIAQIERTIRLVKKIGFITTGFFILGYPGETEQDMEKTLRFAKGLPLDVADFSNFMPLPGSEAFEREFGFNRLDRMDMKMFSSPANIVEGAPGVGLKEKMIRKAYGAFYLRPRLLFSLLGRIRSPYQVFFILKRLVFYLNPAKFLSEADHRV